MGLIAEPAIHSLELGASRVTSDSGSLSGAIPACSIKYENKSLCDIHKVAIDWLDSSLGSITMRGCLGEILSLILLSCQWMTMEV